MNELTIYANKDFGEIRTLVIDNEPWFVGKDVAEALGYSNTRDAIATHVDGSDKNTVAISDGIGNPNKVLINESGLYSLIFGSKLESAKEFKRWVTAEVLPSIRKTGSYKAKPKSQIELLLESVQMLAEQDKKIAELKATQEIQSKQMQEVNDRIDIINGIKEVTTRQSFVEKVKRFISIVGGSFGNGWTMFVRRFNQAYNTNLNLKRQIYCEQHGLNYDKFSNPAYLEAVGLLWDAHRVIDKMLSEVKKDDC